MSFAESCRNSVSASRFANDAVDPVGFRGHRDWISRIQDATAEVKPSRPHRKPPRWPALARPSSPPAPYVRGCDFVGYAL